ncbi:DUF1150 family protein [Bradyrhizobium sp. BR 10261]|nr:DUF1150 family protein [Bradyrhizobium sp. BR 10261]
MRSPSYSGSGHFTPGAAAPLHPADGMPIMLTDSREAAIANAWSNELQAMSVH